MCSMKEVKNMVLSEGVTYSGAVESDGYMDVPHGIGICKYNDHSETGLFQDGELNGIAYINYHEYMYVGICHNRKINGWGIKAYRGGFQFGVFKDNVLKVNLTPLVGIFWNKILNDCSNNPVHVLKNGEIFVGVPQTFEGKFGFHFLGNGEVFLGICDYNENGRTGKFLHFDLDYNITRGEYRDGVLIQEIDRADFVSACGAWANHAYLDFNIDMNYSMDSFLFEEKKIVHIVEMGRTPDNTIVKANICKIIGDRIECEGGTNEDTIWFMFPNNDKEVERQLSEIMDDDEPWAPDFSDYCVEFYNNFREANNDHQIVYKHISCWDKEANYTLNIFYLLDISDFGVENSSNTFGDEDYEDENILSRLIPDFYNKKYLLEEQWRNNNWYFEYPSVRDYVKSLAYGDDVENFFGWLFNDPRLNNASAWSLPHEYEMALHQFFNLFHDLEDE